MSDLINSDELHDFIHLSKTTVHRLRKENDFFEPVRLSKGRIMWRKSDAITWLATR